MKMLKHIFLFASAILQTYRKQYPRGKRTDAAFYWSHVGKPWSVYKTKSAGQRSQSLSALPGNVDTTPWAKHSGDRFYRQEVHREQDTTGELHRLFAHKTAQTQVFSACWVWDGCWGYRSLSEILPILSRNRRWLKSIMALPLLGQDLIRAHWMLSHCSYWRTKLFRYSLRLVNHGIKHPLKVPTASSLASFGIENDTPVLKWLIHGYRGSINHISSISRYNAPSRTPRRKTPFVPTVYFIRKVYQDEESNKVFIEILKEHITLPKAYLGMFVLAQWNLKHNRLRILYENDMKATVIKELNFKQNATTKNKVVPFHLSLNH